MPESFIKNPNTGNQGLSAYEVAVQNGFSGSESDWLLSLVGSQGEQGPQGNIGATGPQGPQGGSQTNPKSNAAIALFNFQNFS